MKMKRYVNCFIGVAIAIVLMSVGVMAQDKPSSPSGTTPASFTIFKNYPDQTFDVKGYTNGMAKGGHNLLIWKDPGINLSQYGSVKLTEFGGRPLPAQSAFSYDPYIALFNSVFKSSVKVPQKDAPDALLVEGAVVECNPGSRTARYMVGFGAGKAACAVVCEVYEPGSPTPVYAFTQRIPALWGPLVGIQSVCLIIS